MTIPFYKYQGTGNDFVIIDHRKHFLEVDTQLVIKLCDRRFGIGADGLILLEEHPTLDFHMIYYNADGSQSFCGNGSRCTVNFAAGLGMIDTSCQFLSTDGEHDAILTTQDHVKLAMHDVTDIEVGDGYYFLNTGSPHYIVYVDDLQQVNVVEEGRKIRYNDRFKAEGTNVNFVQQVANGIKIRTYERGVENETLSCGTGVTAAAITDRLIREATMKPQHGTICEVESMGGHLKVHLERSGEHAFTNVWLEGPAKEVFRGEFQI